MILWPRRRQRLPPLALVACCWAACAPSNAELDRRLAHLEELLAKLKQQGALRCAPRQLAVAQSNAEFYKLEREQGSAANAEEHLEIAERHAKAAEHVSPADRCANQVPDQLERLKSTRPPGSR